MLQTNPGAIACFLLASFLGAVGQHLIKAATNRSAEGLLAYLSSPWVVAGMGCYLMVMVLFTQAFRSGGTVTVLYPIYALTFVWSALIAQSLYGQQIRSVHILGMVLLIVGIYCMSWDNAATQGVTP